MYNIFFCSENRDIIKHIGSYIIGGFVVNRFTRDLFEESAEKERLSHIYNLMQSGGIIPYKNMAQFKSFKMQCNTFPLEFIKNNTRISPYKIIETDNYIRIFNGKETLNIIPSLLEDNKYINTIRRFILDDIFTPYEYLITRYDNSNHRVYHVELPVNCYTIILLKRLYDYFTKYCAVEYMSVIPSIYNFYLDYLNYFTNLSNPNRDSLGTIYDYYNYLRDSSQSGLKHRYFLLHEYELKRDLTILLYGKDDPTRKFCEEDDIKSRLDNLTLPNTIRGLFGLFEGENIRLINTYYFD